MSAISTNGGWSQIIQMITTVVLGLTVPVVIWRLFKVFSKGEDAVDHESNGKKYMGIMVDGGVFVAAVLICKTVIGLVYGGFTGFGNT